MTALSSVDHCWSGNGLDTATKWQTWSAATIQWCRHPDFSDVEGSVWHAAVPDTWVYPKFAATGWIGLGAPNFNTLSRCQQTLKVSLPHCGSTGPLNLQSDSTGIKPKVKASGRTKAPNTAFGVRYTLASMRRRLKCGRLKSPTITWVTHPFFPNFWTKLHPIRTSLALLRIERMIRAFHRSGMNWSRGSIPRRPLFRKCHEPIAARNVHVVVPPRRNAKPWKLTGA